ncbi:MAG: Gamma-glutamyl phosphate reductase [Bacteroidetes bacterium ADurb.Bin302]|nr:MAG: Gamma-glutamyl phosphate reductase [Bacteroidetes bacterium ADurb.Bin302]
MHLNPPNYRIFAKIERLRFMEQNWKEAALIASRKLNLVTETVINNVLSTLADKIMVDMNVLLSANQIDLNAMDKSNPMYDRLQLNEARLNDIASDIRKVTSLPSPLNKIIEEKTLANGLTLTKKTVPFGVIGIIYEARPNVSFDVFSLCFKSGNACVLKGGTDAYNSNCAIVKLIQSVLSEYNLDINTIHLMPAGREATAELMDAVGYVDLIIPRGGSGLINFVRDNSRVPVIETGAGVVHTYFDETGDIAKGAAIINNAKTRRVSVCNALDCLLINEKRLADLPALCAPLAKSNVVLEADNKAMTFLNSRYPIELLKKADENTYGTEFKDYRMGIKTVSDIDAAIAHISKYGSKHSECIITQDMNMADKFQKEVDAACVYVNAPTSFTDGAQFGMGAEIGISTQKLHARGPMALPELCSYKWLINGDGQIRK